jgi:O-antigen/teichoic acid export membrane protein
MLRTAFIILSGNAAASLLLLIRNLVVARMIPVADYGIASTFAMVMAIVEMSSALGLQQQIIQSKDGDDPRFQAALQGFQVLRGCMSGLILFVTAGVMARFLGIPEVAWAYQVLALVPVMNALVHFDIHRINRQMRFWPMLLSGIVPALLSLLLVWPFAYWFGNWQIMLWAIIAQAALTVLVSHVLAERPYRLVWDRTIMAGSLRFGWPLLVNAGLMFLVFQGDKLIVGRTMGMTELAIFSMGTTLTLTPTLVLAKSAQNLFLPRLSRVVGTTQFTLTAQQALQAISLSVLGFILATLLVGGPALNLLLGPKYADLFPILIWFALVQALRVNKAGPAIVSLALGHTSNAMLANLARVLSLFFAAIVALRGGGMLDILIIALAGEALGLLIAIALMLRVSSLPRILVIIQQGAVGMFILMAAAWALYQPPGHDFAPWPIWLASLAIFLTAIFLMPETLRKFRFIKI